ncbi:MAG: hypothetical protein ACREIF_15685 [Chthoniobacterales bacterium]
MKRLRLLILPIAALMLIGWTSDHFKVPASPNNMSDKAKSDDDKKDSTKPPFKGMTKAQALHYYGEPDSIGHRDGEELWTYVLNRGESYAKSFIPFNFKNSLRYRLLTFKDGKVIKFKWDPPERD